MGQGQAETAAPEHAAAEQQTPIVEARAVSKFYGHVRALTDVDFVLAPGETHALVGDNGAGKSTLVKIVAGAITPTAGELRVDGAPQSFTNPGDALEAGISTVHQNLALVGCRGISENLYLGEEPTRRGFLRRGHMRREAARTLTALKQVNLTDMEALVADLSGGQRQALAIARGLRRGRRVLILDEPTAALGVRESAEVLDLILRAKHPGRSMLLVSHNLAHVFRVADRITVLRGGRRVGTVAKSESDPDQIVKMITGASAL